MAPGGRIVNLSSVLGRFGVSGYAAYCAAKHGVIGFTRSLALEGARKGVTANAICPSWTETRMMEEAVEAVSTATGRTAAQAREALLASNPIGRAALPEEVADVAVWLARSPIVTGQAVHVDGGEVMP
jgi:NAD(P)-dependent dehydrogenase (short-subunit alcohol dehydrogenase family)